MSENGGSVGVGAVSVHVIKITFCPDTSDINVTGPFNNATLFLGMLEAAKLSLHEYRAKQAEKRILEAPPGMRL